MFLMVDNYDSFTYNLYALMVQAGAQVKVIRNDEFIPADSYAGIILSPGPSTPQNSGTTLRYLAEYAGKKPIFGVCLGMQAIGHHLGYAVKNAKTIMHGKVDTIRVIRSDSKLFAGMPAEFTAVRYHSLAVMDAGDLVTATAAHDGETMAIEHHALMLYGVQFHPESIESTFGHAIAKNFLTIAGA